MGFPLESQKARVLYYKSYYVGQPTEIHKFVVLGYIGSQGLGNNV